MVDFGSEKRQAVAGLLKHYQPEELVGQKMCFLLNLQRRMLAGSRIAMYGLSCRRR